MADHWAIIVGINQYHFLQPLMQAQNDALGLWRFLVEEAGFAPQQCILLSDLSVSTEHQAVYPDKRAIESWLKTICQEKLAADDVLWIFFSGYGAQAQAQGDDYLIPVDGDPAQVAKTGIKISGIIEGLKHVPTHNFVLILDINRSQSAVAGQSLGSQTIELAQMAGVPLMLSCEPGQFSHETLAVRHGLFTAALLEGLRYQGCLTLGHLADYVKERVPELCEHHWRPAQHPVSVLADTKKFEILLPQGAIDRLSRVSDPGASETDDFDLMVPPIDDMAAAIDEVTDALVPYDTGAGVSGVSSPIEEDFSFAETRHPEDETLSDLEINEEDWPLEVSDEESSASDIAATVDLADPAEGSPLSRRSSPVGLALLLALLLLSVGALFRYQPFFQETLSGVALPSWLSWLQPTSDEAGEEPLGSSTVAAESAETGSDQASTVTSSTAPEATSPAPVASGQEQPATDDPTEPQAAANNGSAPSATAANAARLEAARRLILPNQASRFADAIATAREIKPNEPYYDQAQADIERWSQVILDLAEGRASEGNLETAIASAQLVPADRPQLYQQAQQRIGTWQQRQRSRTLIAEAQKIPRSGQASSYQQGILVLQQVPVGQPEHAAAQALINDWSQKMLTIARARAAQGRNQDAINAAKLILQGTEAYPQAQTDIKRWQGQ